VSLRGSEYHCDRCGVSVGNGSVQNTAIVSDIRQTTDGPVPQRFDLCRDRPDPDNDGKTIQGCRDRVLTRKALRNHMEQTA
jgi:hypothetical protein